MTEAAKKRERLTDEAVKDLSARAAHQAFEAAKLTAKLAVYQDEYASIMMTSGASIIMSTVVNLVTHGCPEQVAREHLEAVFDVVRCDFEASIAKHRTETKQ